MAIKLKDLNRKLNEALKKGLDQITTGNILDKLAQLAVEKIRIRTRLGYGVDKTGGSKRKFDPLSQSYVIQRKRLKKQGKLKGTPKKSNLTKTGEMLDDGLGYVVDKSNNRAIIGMQDDKNARKAAFVSVRRPFLNLSKAEVRAIEKEARDLIRKAFTAAFRRF